MSEYKMWIGGKWADAESGKTYPVFNPVTEAEIARVPLGDKADVDKAVEAARKAFPIWSKKSQGERFQMVMKIAAIMRENAKEIARIDTLEHGTPAGLASMIAGDLPEWFEWNAYNARSLMGNTVPQGHDELIYLQREPVGVVALITPWNLPLLMIVEKLAPALSVGNTCIIKPASINSLTALKLAELLDKVGLPPGTVNVITGPGGIVGEALASHRDVNMVAFTGSSETGKTIMGLASKTVKRLQLELGGKNPVIILYDTNVNQVAESMVGRQTFNCGQICASPGRYYIHEKVYDEFIEKFTAGMKKVVVGDPNDETTQMGPLVSAEHRNRVESYVKSAVVEGAKVILGGKRPTIPPLNKGYYFGPTIITNVTQKMKVAREEIFGPVAIIMEKFNSDDKVIEMANDNVYGLAAYVFTQDAARGMRFANELQAGTVQIGRTPARDQDVPWGGFKESGIGKEHSMVGLYEYTNLKRIQVDLTLRK